MRMRNLIKVFANTPRPSGNGGGGATGTGPSGISDFFGAIDIPDTVNILIRYLFWGVVAAAAVYFAVGCVFGIVGYFKADNEREKTEAKDKALQKGIGIIICLLAGALLNLLLTALGLNAHISV